MSRSGHFILWGCVGVGVFLFGLLAILASRTEPVAARPPELGGQAVPARVHEIGFDRAYDLHCTFPGEERKVYRGCKILGFTGRGEESARSSRGSGSGGFSLSSGSGSYSREYFDHWLVLELADKRLAYLPPAAVKSIEEAAPAVP